MKALILSSLLLLLFASGSYCQEKSPAAVTRSDLQEFLDEFMRKQLKDLRIPGATVAIVSDGKVILCKGYGSANIELHRRVKPKTLFRLGSISKVFTTIAILQLVEQGKLSLQDDVSQYVKTFHIDNPFPEPLRVFHLLTHTGGFDERNIGSAALKESQILPLGRYLAKRMPPIVRPPGDLISYSNHGFTLAGYLVELLSGTPFSQYIDEHILKPLGMNNSSFHFHPDASVDIATGYLYKGKRNEPVPFDYFNDGPADSFVTDAPDMGRFLTTMLQQGRYMDVQILKPETVAEMERQHFTHHPGMPGWCYGFWEHEVRGIRGLEHDGGVYGFTSRIFLVPDKNFAFFVATNSDPTSRGLLLPIFTSRIVEFFFPDSPRPPNPRPGTDFQQRAHLYEGVYRHTTAAVRSLEKIEVLLGFVPEVTVEANPNGRLSIGRENYVELEPLFFERTTGRGYASFRQDKTGAVTHLLMEQEAFERIRWYDMLPFQVACACTCLALFLSACIVWLVKTLLRNRPNPLARQYMLTGMLSLSHVVFTAAMIGIFEGKALYALSYPAPLTLKLSLVLPLVALVLTPLSIYSIVRSWMTRSGRLLSRIHLSVTAAAAVAFLWFLNYWNLIGFRY